MTSFTQVQYEAGLLVATQLGFCVLGTFVNNIAFITIKDLPGVKATTYNVLLCHIVLGRQLVRKICQK